MVTCDKPAAWSTISKTGLGRRSRAIIPVPGRPPRVAAIAPIPNTFALFTNWDEDKLQTFDEWTDVKTQNKVLLDNQLIMFRCLKQYVCEVGPALKKLKRVESGAAGADITIDMMTTFKDKFLAAEKTWLAADIIANGGMKNLFILTLDDKAKHVMVNQFLLKHNIVAPTAQKVFFLRF